MRNLMLACIMVMAWVTHASAQSESDLVKNARTETIDAFRKLKSNLKRTELIPNSFKEIASAHGSIGGGAPETLAIIAKGHLREQEIVVVYALDQNGKTYHQMSVSPDALVSIAPGTRDTSTNNKVEIKNQTLIVSAGIANGEGGGSYSCEEKYQLKDGNLQLTSLEQIVNGRRKKLNLPSGTQPLQTFLFSKFCG